MNEGCYPECTLSIPLWFVRNFSQSIMRDLALDPFRVERFFPTYSLPGAEHGRPAK